jgi:hypothetical protein
VVAPQDGDASIGVAVIGVVDDATPGALALALEFLDTACRDLDGAVLALPHGGDDDFMASSSVVALLLRVVTARRLVKRLKLEVKAEISDRLRASTLS